MATVYKGTDAQVAHLLGVIGSVQLKAAVIKAAADALFASHNNPGGHELELDHGITDSFVSLTGRAPLTVEYGRAPNANGKGRMDGLHILGRAANL